MFKIGILLKFIDAINTSWHPLQTSGWNLNPLSTKSWHYFDALFLLTSISSEIAVISK